MRKLLCAMAIGAAAFTTVYAGDPAKKDSEIQCCPMDPKASATLDRIKKLEGTWSMPGPDGKPMNITFKPTAGGSAVIETMFPGSKEEMVNLYTADGDKILVTHYCALGQQPRMKQAATDDKTIKFEFVDGGNIESRDDAHMDSVALTIDGDTLTETWSFYSGGKVVDTKTFDLKRAK